MQQDTRPENARVCQKTGTCGLQQVNLFDCEEARGLHLGTSTRMTLVCWRRSSLCVGQMEAIAVPENRPSAKNVPLQLHTPISTCNNLYHRFNQRKSSLRKIYLFRTHPQAHQQRPLYCHRHTTKASSLYRYAGRRMQCIHSMFHKFTLVNSVTLPPCTVLESHNQRKRGAIKQN
mmetsp:Transcript_800/g.2716  ORF Transcript_800/g.2716 Transcript_800/m.2716 type:complete len:175 (-) Transcript_800:1392-1916(-)